MRSACCRYGDAVDRDTRVGCHAWIERVGSDGRAQVLLTRCPGVVLADGRRVRAAWTLPGGRLRLRESPGQAVVRAVAQETGYAVRLTRVLGTDAVLVPPHDRRHPEEQRFLQQVTLVWAAEVVPGQLPAEQSHGRDSGWVAVDELDGRPCAGVVAEAVRMLGREPLRQPMLSGTPVDEDAVALVLAAVEKEQARRGSAGEPGELGSVRPRGVDGPFVVAVDGPSGSGKSVLATAVARDLRAPLLHMDDLFPGWDGLAQASALLAEQVLEPLARGGRAAYRRWDWHRDGWGEQVPVPPAELLVVEGCGSSVGPAAQHVTVAVWVEADHRVRMRRGLARDGETYRPHWERWAAQEQQLFATDGTRDRADVVVRTG